MMLKDVIKEKAWDKLQQFNNLNDEDFNTTAISFKISEVFNFVIWCEIDSELNKDRCYIVSVRYNPYDDLFGDDMGAEWETMDTSKEELENAIEYVLSHKSLQ